jgi:hypothetical protein
VRPCVQIPSTSKKLAFEFFFSVGLAYAKHICTTELHLQLGFKILSWLRVHSDTNNINKRLLFLLFFCGKEAQAGGMSADSRGPSFFILNRTSHAQGYS